VARMGKVMVRAYVEVHHMADNLLEEVDMPLLLFSRSRSCSRG